MNVATGSQHETTLNGQIVRKSHHIRQHAEGAGHTAGHSVSMEQGVSIEE
jgi:hypothetical protein